MGIILCSCNNKGGVGKTSFSCNLGVSLAKKGKSVLVIDNDSQCNSTDILRQPKTVFENTMYEVYEDAISGKSTIPIETAIYQSKYNHLSILPNSEATSGIDMELGSKYPDSLPFLRQRVRDYAVANFDFTIIDNPPTLSIFVGNSLYASDFVVVPVDSESAHSIEGLRKILELIESIQSTGNPDLRFLRILVNRIDKRTNVGKVVVAEIHRRFGDEQVFKTTIPSSTTFREAEFKNETIFDNAPASKGAIAYRDVAKEILGIFNGQG